MGSWPRRAALGMALGAVALTSGPVTAEAPGDESAVAARDVMLSDIGEGWRVVDEETGIAGSFTRTFESAGAQLLLNGFHVETPPGVETLFDGFVAADTAFDARPEPSLELAVWLVIPGQAIGDSGLSSLMFASREHIWSIILVLPDGSPADGPRLALDVAGRQIEAAGGQPSAGPAPPDREVDDGELLEWMPLAPPVGSGLDSSGATFIGPGVDEIELLDSNEVTDFLSRRSQSVARVWASSTMSAAVGITRYPYDVFAASALAVQDDDLQPIGDGRIEGLRDAVTFRQPDRSQVGIVFRRGDVLVTVLAMYVAPDTERSAIAAATGLALDTAARLPAGATGPYDLTPPSRFVGLALTIVIVPVAIAGSRAITWIRARRIRRRWAADEPELSPPPPDSPPTRVVDLDADAEALRRRGRGLVAIQLVTVTTGVVALAGDFATPGMLAAAIALVAGLAITRWWMHRELSLLGPSAPPRAFVFPRLPGAVLGLAAFAVLGIGVAYLLKGIRYLALPVSLAQLRWSDLLGISPRAVGIAFAVGGVVATALGGALYRAARALSRAGAQRVLQADPRPPALYLRSFSDDSLPLPVSPSARRPLFELFSLRGGDPFEESVAWELSSYAPVVAVGRPGGTLHTLGAAREHLAQETWRDEIAARMRDAGLIVLAPGETEGLEWELGEIVRGAHLGKSVFVFPPLPPSDLHRRWCHTADLLRTAGAAVGEPAVAPGRIHTVRVEDGGGLFVTAASTRDEATYRTAVDRAVEGGVPSGAPPPALATAAGG